MIRRSTWEGGLIFSGGRFPHCWAPTQPMFFASISQAQDRLRQALAAKAVVLIDRRTARAKWCGPSSTMRADALSCRDPRVAAAAL